jgi:hypothetical protein
LCRRRRGVGRSPTVAQGAAVGRSTYLVRSYRWL